METNFKLKALKYKKKYVDLKNMIGGANEWEYDKDGRWIAYSSDISGQIENIGIGKGFDVVLDKRLYYIIKTSPILGKQINSVNGDEIPIQRKSNSTAAAQPVVDLPSIYRQLVIPSQLPPIYKPFNASTSHSPDDKGRRDVMIRTHWYLRTPGIHDNLKQIAKDNLEGWQRPPPRQQNTNPMIVSVVMGDWGYVTLELTKMYGVPFTVLNMANAIKFGGGYKNGASAQEENMFRRTTCSLDRTGLLDATTDTYSPRMTDLLNGLNDRVYFTKEPRVCFLESDDKNYKHLDPTEIFPFYELRSAAEDISKGKTFDYGDCDRRIRAQLDTLQANGITHVVLSAFGCGAFKNPPLEVATIYRDILNESDRGFKVVVFAIYRPSYSSDNYSPFKHILEPSSGKLTSHLQPLLDKKYPPSVVVAPSKQAYSPNPACQYGLNCTRQNPQHFLDETHPPTHQKAVAIPPPSVTPSKPACPYGLGCTRQNPQHFLDEAHPPTHSLVKAVVIQKCKVPDCYEQHTKHHCGNCGNNDSDHRRRNCPFQQRR